MATLSFSVLPVVLNILVHFSPEKLHQDNKSTLNTFTCLLDLANKASLKNIKLKRQKKPEKPLILGRSEIQYVAMVTKLIISHCRVHPVESCCQESIISDTNSLRYLAYIYLIKFWLSVWCHHLANLHILKTRISLERKEIFEKFKRYFTSHTKHLFMS